MCSQAAGAERERSGGACVAAALAQDRSLATAGSAHLKHVQAVFYQRFAPGCESMKFRLRRSMPFFI